MCQREEARSWGVGGEGSPKSDFHIFSKEEWVVQQKGIKRMAKPGGDREGGGGVFMF